MAKIAVKRSELAEFDGLVDWLASGEWKNQFEAKNTNTQGCVVLSLKHAVYEDEFDEADLRFVAEIREPSARLRSVTLDFYIDPHDDVFPIIYESDCTCVNTGICKHLYITLESLAAIAGPAAEVKKTVSNAEIERWLQLIRETERVIAADVASAVKPAKPYNKFLAYCITFRKHYYHDSNILPYLSLHQGSYKKSGEHNIEDGLATADLVKRPKYMANEDFPICAAFHAKRQRSQAWENRILLNGPDFDFILDSALATGRLFIGTQKSDYRSPLLHNKLTEGPHQKIEPSWELDEDGSARPILKLTSTTSAIIPTQPLRYIDFETNTIGLLHSDVPREILLVWPSGPVISAERIPELNFELRAIPSAIPLPTPAEKPAEILVGLTPVPTLHVTWVTCGVFQFRHIGGLVSFQYPGCPALAPLAHGAFEQHTWVEGDMRMILQRDAAAEKSQFDTLLENGLVALSSLVADQDLNAKNRGSVVLGTTKATSSDWLDFLTSEQAEAIRSAGWTITSDPKLGLTVHDIADFFPAIEADPDHGIDWFRFDVTGEFDGKKVSLIPQIARAISEDWLERYSGEKMPETLLIPCDEPSDGHIRFPAKRFLEMVDQVRHLFHGSERAGGPLRMDRLSAAGMADALSIESSETTRALAELGRNLRDIKGLPPAEVPASIQAELRPYQIDGFRWLQFLSTHGLHGILADDMGLGKTLQTLAHLTAEIAKFPDRPSLVIAPTSVVPNWADEAEKFAPHLKVLVLHGGERSEYFDQIKDHNIVLTTYPLLVRDFDELAKHHWHTVVLDEAQYIKNSKAITSYSACKLKAQHRICLSGTPMENHLGELWSLMRFLMPGFLSDEKSFNAFLRKPIERDHSTDAQVALNRRISPLILRRTKDQVATELPEKTTIIHGINLAPKQTDLYESVRAVMDSRVREAIESKGLAKSHIIVLDALLKLRQICCDPQLLKSDAARRVNESAKLEFLTKELLPQLIDEGRRILLFSQFTSMLELIEEHLELQDISFLKLTGQTKERAKLVKKFQTGEVPIFLISLKAGGTGLNLTAADTVIHYDPWWNPAAENQATDRAHRIGQTKPVFVHKLVCRGTIEERILELQKQKSALVEALLSEDTSKLRIDAETLSHLLAPLA